MSKLKQLSDDRTISETNAGAIIAAYDSGAERAIRIIKKELRRRIDATNTLPEQQQAYKSLLNWIEEES